MCDCWYPVTKWFFQFSNAILALSMGLFILISISIDFLYVLSLMMSIRDIITSKGK